jgi:hypothetical protein
VSKVRLQHFVIDGEIQDNSEVAMAHVRRKVDEQLASEGDYDRQVDETLAIILDHFTGNPASLIGGLVLPGVEVIEDDFESEELEFDEVNEFYRISDAIAAIERVSQDGGVSEGPIDY